MAKQITKSEISEKMRIMEACVDTAGFLLDAPFYKQPLVALEATEFDELKAEQRLSRGMIAHLDYAIVLELVIKVIWELDNKRPCEHTHNIYKLYGELSEKSKRQIETIYDNNAVILANQEGKDKQGNTIRLGDLVSLQTLQEGLQANEETMKDYKYDGRLRGKSSALGSVIWDENIDLLWVLPALQFKRVPEALCEYAKNRIDSAP